VVDFVTFRAKVLKFSWPTRRCARPMSTSRAVDPTIRRRVQATVAGLAIVLAALVLPAHRALADQTFDQRMLTLLNQDRAANGLAPLVADPTLGANAEDAPYLGCGFTVLGRATDMGVRNYFSHSILGCVTQTVFNILGSTGLVYSGAGENIAWANALTDPLVAAANLESQLMNSPDHRANILNPNFTKVGIGSWHTSPGQTWSGGGYALGNVYIGVQIFAGGPVTTTTTPTTVAPTTTTTVAPTTTTTLPTAPSPGGGFHPLTPARILDTRTTAAVGPGATMNLQVTGQGGIPSTGVTAAVLNVTVTAPTATSFLTVFPAGAALPLAANLNFLPGQTIANLVTAKVGANGQVSLYNLAGYVHVIADVAGWYDTGTDPTGAGFHPLTPARILDTRTAGAPLGAGATMNVQVTGRGGVPTTGVTAAVINVTVTDTTGSSFLTVFPSGQALPLAANINWSPGQTVPNLVTAKLGASGQLSVYNLAGNASVIADVAGWYDTGTDPTGAGFHALTPSRILDTRSAAPLGAATTMNLQVAGQGGIPSTGVTAVVLNVTVTAPTATSFLTVFPAGSPLPLAANLNYAPAQTVPNLVIAKVGANGQVSIYNLAGSVHVIADVAGWYDAG
jgi:uncharacterized protein YkwD